MTRSTLVAATTAAVILAALPRAAAAQAPPQLRVGQSITGALTAGDPATTNNGRFKVYRVELQEGQRLVATLDSDDFDAMISLLRPVGGITEEIGSDDDGGEGTNSRLRFVAPATGAFLLLAQSFSAEGMGSFTIALQEAAPPRAATPQPIRIGERREGSITEDAPLLVEYNSEILYDLYTFEARAGQELAILLESDDFDAFLSFGPLSGSDIDITGADDDSGGGTNARLRVTIPADGRYGFHARALGALGTGRYVVTLSEVVVPPPQPLTAGAAISSTLGDGDTDGDGKHYQRWVYAGSAGERVTIRMRSDDFDTYLILGRMVDGALEELAVNDDAFDDGSNSLIEFTLPATGEYIIRATTFGRNEEGQYTLQLVSAR